jgi:hypothetical protein
MMSTISPQEALSIVYNGMPSRLERFYVSLRGIWSLVMGEMTGLSPEESRINYGFMIAERLERKDPQVARKFREYVVLREENRRNNDG